MQIFFILSFLALLGPGVAFGLDGEPPVPDVTPASTGYTPQLEGRDGNRLNQTTPVAAPNHQGGHEETTKLGRQEQGASRAGSTDRVGTNILNIRRDPSPAFTKINPNSTLNSEEMGFRNLGEYRNAMPALASEQRDAFQLFQQFSQAMEEFAQEKRAEAQKFRQMQGELLARARGLGEIPQGDGNPTGPLLSQTGQSRAPGEETPGTGPAAFAPQSSGRAYNPIEGPARLANLPIDQRNKISRPGFRLAEANAKRAPASAEGSADAVAKAFEAKGALKELSTISLAERNKLHAAGVSSAEPALPAAAKAWGKAGLAAVESTLQKLQQKKVRERLSLPRMANQGEREEESPAQSALRGALETADQASAASGKNLLAKDNSRGNEGGSSAGGAFSLAGPETDEAVRKLTGTLEEKQPATNGVLGLESENLFDRVHAAHRRSEKNWHHKVAQLDL